MANQQPDLLTVTMPDQQRQKAEQQILNNRNEFAWGLREWSIEHILEKFGESGDPDSDCELYIPDYQRDYKWPVKIASRFIESILIGFPIPYLYIATVEDIDNQEQDGRIEIIDGSQRIRALKYFFDNEFPLTDLKELNELQGFFFRDLLPGRQRKLKRESLRLIELKSDSDGDYRRNLFERINSGFVPLIPMEVRRGSEQATSRFYQDILQPCSENQNFRNIAPLTKGRQSNADYQEMVLRFFAYSEKLDDYNGNVREFLDNYLKEKADDPNINIEAYVNKFNTMVDFVAKTFPNGFRKSPRARSVSRTYFEAIAIGSQFALEEAATGTKKLDTDHIQDWINSEEFKKIVTSDAANNTSKLRARIHYVRDKLLGNIDL